MSRWVIRDQCQIIHTGNNPMYCFVFYRRLQGATLFPISKKATPTSTRGIANTRTRALKRGLT